MGDYSRLLNCECLSCSSVVFWCVSRPWGWELNHLFVDGDPSLNWRSNASKPDQPVISSFVTFLQSVAEASEEEEEKKNNQD